MGISPHVYHALPKLSLPPERPLQAAFVPFTTPQRTLQAHFLCYFWMLEAEVLSHAPASRRLPTSCTTVTQRLWPLRTCPALPAHA